MNSFVSKQILSSQTIGEQLKKARQGQGIPLKEISKILGIKEKYLLAIEDGLYSELPGDIYALEFIKKYALFLKIDPRKAGRFYSEEKKNNSPCDYGFSARLGPNYFLNKDKKFSVMFFALVFFLSSMYALFSFRHFFYTPYLSVEPISDYIETYSSSIDIYGMAEPSSAVFINSERINISDDGYFLLSYDLPKGTNLIQISSKGRFGKTTRINKIVFVK